MRYALNLLNCKVNMTFFYKNHEIILTILKKMKNRYHENITFVAIVKLVAHTLLCEVKLVVNNNGCLL